VFYGVDNTFLTRALAEDLFIPHDSPMLAQIPDEFKLDPGNRALPVDYGDVCINYDKAYFATNDLPVPTSLEELTDPQYAGLLVAQNPATSSPGLAFLMATIAHFGEDGYLDYWAALKQNGLVVVSDWETAYYTNFSGSTGQGPQPMVVSYGSSPAAEVIFAETELDQAPTGSIIGPDTCFRQIEFVGILRNTPNPDLAGESLTSCSAFPSRRISPCRCLSSRSTRMPACLKPL
jgi:thiamine transport system substrate-binding protein